MKKRGQTNHAKARAHILKEDFRQIIDDRIGQSLGKIGCARPQHCLLLFVILLHGVFQKYHELEKYRTYCIYPFGESEYSPCR